MLDNEQVLCFLFDSLCNDTFCNRIIDMKRKYDIMTNYEDMNLPGFVDGLPEVEMEEDQTEEHDPLEEVNKKDPGTEDEGEGEITPKPPMERRTIAIGQTNVREPYSQSIIDELGCEKSDQDNLNVDLNVNDFGTQANFDESENMHASTIIASPERLESKH